MGEGGGSGPGDHPGVTIVELTGDIATDQATFETQLEAGADFLCVYGSNLAVFASGYKK